MLSGKLKILLISCVLVMPGGCELKRPPFAIDTAKYGEVMNREAAGPGILIRKRAIQVYQLNYFIARNHKAMVQASSGSWSWSYRHATIDGAIDRALQLCRDHNRSREGSEPCQLVNVDGYWIADFRERQ